MRSFTARQPGPANPMGTPWTVRFSTRVFAVAAWVPMAFAFLLAVPAAPADGADAPPPEEKDALWKLALDARDVHRFSTLFTAQDVRGRLSSPEGLDAAIDWCRKTGVTRVFVESFRDGYRAERETLERARDRLREAGLDVSGCVTPTQVGKRSTGWNIIACYTDPKTQENVRDIFEYTAGLFDEIMIDDFWFTDCACEACEAGRKARTVTVGEKTYPVAGDSWEDYRSELMVRLSEVYVLGAAKRVDPRARLIIKYPQWYDRFHERGYDVARQTRDFDLIWVGTETRDYDDRRWGGTVQYEAYFIMRWLGGIGGERCGGGWFDPYGTTERTYVEQARQTVLGGARESLLFCYGSLLGGTGPRNVEVLREHIPELLRVARAVRGRRPVGIAAYKPIASHPEEEPRVFDFVGMLGIPLVPCHELPLPLPDGVGGAFLSVHALKDPGIAGKIRERAERGTPLLVTDGLAKRLGEKAPLDRPNVVVLEVRGEPKSILELPQERLDGIRSAILGSAPLWRDGAGGPRKGVAFRAPSRVGLYLFEDGSRVIENFDDAPVDVELDGAKIRVEARGWVQRWK